MAAVPESPSSALRPPVCSLSLRSSQDPAVSPASADVSDWAVAPLLVDSVYSIPLFSFVHSDIGNTSCRLEQVPEEAAAVLLVDSASYGRRDMDSSDSSSRCSP